MKIGDILTYSYSYNCRRPQFVRVTRVTPKSVAIEELQHVYADGDYMNGTVVPRLDTPNPRKLGTFRVKNCSSFGDYIKIDGHYATLWDGTPEMSYSD